MAKITNEDLRDFVVKESANLIELGNELKTFNIFDVLRISHKEIRHSNFIGWLLDPKQGHGFGDFFLLSFINTLTGISNEKSIDYNIGNLYNTQVIRETEKNIDIFIKNEELSFTITIENKIRSGESEKQLENYYSHITEKYKSIDDNYFVFLTPWGIKPKKAKMQSVYQTFDYHTLIGIIQNGLDRFDTIDPEIRIIIKQYIKNVKRNVLKMDSTTKKAQEIYQKHKDVIDFIINNKLDLSKINKKVRSYFEEHEDYEIVSPNEKKCIRFMPKDDKFKAIFYCRDANYWEGDYLLGLEVWVKGEFIELKFSLGGIKNNDEETINQIFLEKVKLHAELKEFDSLKQHTKIAQTKPSPNSKTSYTTLAYKWLLTTQRFWDSNHDDMFDAFKEAFEQYHTTFFKQFIQEAKEKLTPLSKQ